MLTEYMGRSKSNEIRKNFRTSDNQFLIKFWLPTFRLWRF